MDTMFGIDKIFEIAQNIELDGAQFYRQAAAKTSNDDIKRVLLDLAVMEDGHIKIFEQMRKELSEPNKNKNLFAADNKIALYLKTMVDGLGSERIKSPLEKLSGNETIKEIIEIAIDGEKASMLFYIGLKELVPSRANKDQIEYIIKEEFSHLVALNLNLTVLG
ncbi:ferritin family protein [Planctomycetota bacterium]